MATEPGMVEFLIFLFYFIFEHFQSTQKHVDKVFRNGCIVHGLCDQPKYFGSGAMSGTK
jgi:hypothetical protein